MKLFKVICLIFLIFAVSSCSSKNELVSPDGKISVMFKLNENGEPQYQVKLKNNIIIKESKLGFKLESGENLLNDFKISDSKFTSHNETWETVWGADKKINNNYNEQEISLVEKSNNKRKLKIFFRAFDDGIAFRYEFPEQENLKEFRIIDEITEFNFRENFDAWWIVADYNSYEKIYNHTDLKKMSWAGTPFTLENKEGLHISVHEAALTNYSGMTVKQSASDSLSFTTELVPYADGTTKVIVKTPFKTPWRTIQITNSAAKLVESNLILNLNEPNKIEKTEWIKPAKYIGIWWGMHIGIETWGLDKRHGATTKNTKRYIDFAAANNIQGVLIEGWNTGWEDWGKPEAFDFVTPYKDFNLPELAKYAEDKGVELVGHHETGGDFITYEKYLDSAFALYHKLGVNYVKTGYAGPISVKEHHHGQRMVNHYRKVIETAAKYNIMIDAHEPIKATGIRRTFPNMMTREGVRGMEWNAWSDGNPPEHTCILPFTRGLGGPIDYTAGIFDVKLKNFEKQRKKWNAEHIGKTRVHTTVAKQLALMVVLYSPLQMAADVVDNYKDQPAFKFVENLKMNYTESKILNGKIGDFITVARKADDEWFIGAITDENERTLDIKLDFLEPGIKYKAEIYKDGEGADWISDPYNIETTDISVDNKTELKLQLAAGGGQAIRLVPQK